MPQPRKNARAGAARPSVAKRAKQARPTVAPNGAPIVSAPKKPKRERSIKVGGADSGASSGSTPITPGTLPQTAGAQDNADTLLTRRNFLYGAVGLGAVAAIAGGVSFATAGKDEKTVPYLQVPETNVFTLEECTEVSRDEMLTLVASYDMPFGTLLWANNDAVAACLFPTDVAKPLTQAGVLMLSTGESHTLLEAAIGQEEGFDIYDVRASETGFVWTEANVLENQWRIYAASLSGTGSLGKPVKIAEGSGDWETPTIALVKNSVFWLMAPRAGSPSAKTEQSQLLRCGISGGEPQCLYVEDGRMKTPLYSCTSGVVITPSVPDASSYAQLVYLTENDGQVADSLTLPSGMAPLEAAWGATGFSFCYREIYNYGDGIANLGTYTPAIKPTDGNYDASQWFRFARTPSAAPAWCGALFLVKSTTNVAAVDVVNKRFCTLGVESGCTDWGDHLVSTGSGNLAITNLTLNQTATTGEVTKRNLVRVWRSN